MIRAGKQLIWIFEGGSPESSESFWKHFDSGPARIIRITLESFLIRAWIQDPRFLGGLPKESWIQYLPESSDHFGIIFDSGWDPRSKIPGRDSWAILDLGSPRESKNDSNMIRKIRASTGSKVPWEDLPGILDLGSWIQARIKNDSKMIRMIRAGPESKMIPK